MLGGGVGGRGVLLVLAGLGSVALAVALTIVPIAMSGSFTSLPAFSSQNCTQSSSQLTASR